MRVTIVSDTIQEFNGKRYYFSGHYFQRQGERLHIAVWKYYNGDIPKGYHIHHKDEDRHNNQIENLQMVKAYEHLSRHSSARDEYNQKHIKDMRELANEWHGSDEGRAWHSEHAKESWQKKGYNKYTCSCCGKEFETRHDYGADQNTFCSNACKAKHRAHSGIDNEERICAYCGKPFTVNKYAKRACCSRECGVRRRWGK